MTTTKHLRGDPVVHPRHGIGVIVDTIGLCVVVVQWPGLPMARRESVDDVERYVAPPPARRRRGPR